MAVESYLVPLGTPAPDFTLPAVSGGEVKLADLPGTALLVVFLSNHCPYVRHVEAGLARFAHDYAGSGLDIVGVSSNDPGVSPDDDAASLAAQIVRTGFPFPYLIDADQSVAKAYRAACTPDFFLYGEDRTLLYRGAFDLSRPRNDTPVTGELLRDAVDRVLNGGDVPEPHRPSAGCSIKWAPGNEPE